MNPIDADRSSPQANSLRVPSAPYINTFSWHARFLIDSRAHRNNRNAGAISQQIELDAVGRPWSLPPAWHWLTVVHWAHVPAALDSSHSRSHRPLQQHFCSWYLALWPVTLAFELDLIDEPSCSHLRQRSLISQLLSGHDTIGSDWYTSLWRMGYYARCGEGRTRGVSNLHCANFMIFVWSTNIATQLNEEFVS